MSGFGVSGSTTHIQAVGHYGDKDVQVDVIVFADGVNEPTAENVRIALDGLEMKVREYTVESNEYEDEDSDWGDKYDD